MDDKPGLGEAEAARSFACMVEKVRDYAIFLMDADGIIRTWSPAAAQMKGYAPHEAIGRPLGMLYTQEQQASGDPEDNLRKAAERGTFQEEAWRRKKDGSLFWALVEIIAIPDASGELTGFCKITRDLTYRMALMQQLARERQRAQITLSAISDAVVSFDEKGGIDFLNEKAEELTGWRVAEARGQPVAAVIDLRDPDQQDKRVLPAAPRPGPPRASLLVSRAGKPREVEHAVASIRQRDGAGAGGVIVLRDTSHLRFVEKELKHADRRKDEFLAMLAHELRNPLAPISAAAELLAMDRLDAKGVQRTSQVIGRQVRHMTSLIDDLLDVSRVTRGLVVLERTELDVKAVVADALEQVRPLIESRSHHLAVHLEPGDAFVDGDKKRLVQVVTNVLGNAAKYTPAGGHIALAMHVEDERVVLSVQDDGIGMSPEFVERAFQMFAQAERSPDRAQGGLGLGLALVRSLVELHGGTVAAESAGRGCGSRFTIALPRVVRIAPQQPWSGTADPAAVAARTPLRVLVVDDNVDAADLLAEFLHVLGHEVAVEHHSRGALTRVERFVPHVCLLDIGLPDLDGFELARRLRQSLGGVMLVALTGYGQPDDVRNSVAAGFDRHFVKPVETQHLLAVLAEAAAAVDALAAEAAAPADRTQAGGPGAPG